MMEGIPFESGENAAEENEKMPRPVPLSTTEDQIGLMDKDFTESGYSDQTLFTMKVEHSRAIRELAPENTSIYRAIGGEGLLWAMEHIDPEVGRHFQAHGIEKGDPVKLMDALLTKGVDSNRTLYTTTFNPQVEASGALGAAHARTSGGIVLVSHFDQKMDEGGVKYLILGEEYNRMINLLQQKYPDVKVIPWNEAVKELTEEYNRQTGEHREYEAITDENRPAYGKKEFSAEDSAPALPPESPLEEWVDVPESASQEPSLQPENPDDLW